MRDERQAEQFTCGFGKGAVWRRDACHASSSIFVRFPTDGRTDGRGVVVGAVRIAATVSDRDLGA